MSKALWQWVESWINECQEKIAQIDRACEENTETKKTVAKLIEVINRLESPHREVLEPDAKALESQLKELENAIQKHHEERAQLKKRLDALEALMDRVTWVRL